MYLRNRSSQNDYTTYDDNENKLQTSNVRAQAIEGLTVGGMYRNETDEAHTSSPPVLHRETSTLGAAEWMSSDIHDNTLVHTSD